MRNGFILTRKEAAEIFWLLSRGKIKFTGKDKTLAEKYYNMFEESLGINPLSKNDF